MILFLCAPAVLINLDKVCIKMIQKSLWSIVMNIFCWASAWACKEVSNRQSIHDRATWNCLALPQLLVTCVKDQFWYFVLFLYLEKSCLDQLKKNTLYLVTICDLSKKITCSSIILGMPPKADYWKYFNVVGVVAYCLIAECKQPNVSLGALPKPGEKKRICEYWVNMIYNEVYRRLARHSPRAEANIVKACNTMQWSHKIS